MVLRVKDLERSKKFFTEVLGLPIVGEAPNGMLFFSPDVEANHHLLAIRQAEKGARMPDPELVGMEHLAYELGSFAELQEAYRIFQENHVKFRHVVFHGVTKSIYFYDPDGNLLEVYCNVPPEKISQDGQESLRTLRRHLGGARRQTSAEARHGGAVSSAYHAAFPIAQRSRLARYSRNSTMRIATARRTRSCRSAVVA